MNKAVNSSSARRILLILLGLWLLFGAFVSLSGGRWPAFMPSQLDLLVIPLTWLSRVLGVAVGGILAGALGAASLWLGIRSPTQA